MIYLDYAATTPISEEALHMYNEISKHYFGNPSSLHDIGSSSHQIVEASRSAMAKIIQGETKGIYFTSGGSESNTLAIRSIVYANEHKGKHVITSQVEHSSTLNTFQMLEKEGFHVSYIPVDEHGEIMLDELRKVITPETIFLSIIHVNSEIGTIQPLEEIGLIAKEHQILFHSDCVQSFGKVPINVSQWNLSSISMSAHKIYGPKGVGACYIAPHIRWKPTIPSTTHENGFRPGTLNVPGIASFVTAAHGLSSDDSHLVHMKELSSYFVRQLAQFNDRIVLEGQTDKRIPHIHGLRIKGVEGQYTMLECNRYGVAISTGSACQAGMKSPSKTMLAMGRNQEEAFEFIRVTFGKHTTVDDIDKLIEAFHHIIEASKV